MLLLRSVRLWNTYIFSVFASFFCIIHLKSSFILTSRSLVTPQPPHRVVMSIAMERSTPLVSERIVKQLNAWCGLHGLMYTDGHINWTPAPLSLLPVPFSRKPFNYAQNIQPTWNKLIDRISRDREFITKELSSVSNADDFTSRLVKLYATVPADVLSTAVQFGVLRSDYMVNHDDHLLQVEINTISSSFGCLSRKVHLFHNYLLDRNSGDNEMKELVEKVTDVHKTPEELKNAIVENASLQKIAASIAAAHTVYGNKDAVVLFIVQPNERNLGDQRALELQLWSAHGVKCEFLTLHDIAQFSVVGDNDRHLTIKVPDSQSFEVSVAYFRAGYTPNDYPTEEEWKARELIEKSKAIKCPSVGYHLAGTKAIQAALCKPGILERFLSTEECEELRLCFAEQYSLGDEETKDACRVAFDAASQDGSGWVLKPQREGGGNNYYNENLSQFLSTHKDDPILSGFVLMQRIFPKLQSTIFCRQGHCEFGQSISEVGIYGTYLGYGNTKQPDIMNDYAGYLLRTKGSGTDEGGVATGYSVLNSIALHD